MTEIVSALLALAAAVALAPANAQITLRMIWYSGGNEGEVMANLLHHFEQQNLNTRGVLDQVLLKAIDENLPVQLASGQ